MLSISNHDVEQQQQQQQSIQENNNETNEKKYNELYDVGPDDETLVYRSGIPTLRSSTHRVKDPYKSRQMKGHRKRTLKKKPPKGLPNEVVRADIWSYDTEEYNFAQAIQNLLQRCSSGGTQVGNFLSNDCLQLEDFIVPPQSVWKTASGGCCEEAQQVLSDQVIADEILLNLFDRFVENVVVPHLKQKLQSAGVVGAQDDDKRNPTIQKKDSNNRDNDTNTTSTNKNDDDNITMTFYCQRPPTLRLQPGPARAGVKPHHDSIYGHQIGELNFWLPLTNRDATQVDLWCESQPKLGDYQPLQANYGQIISFYGSSCRHFVNRNLSRKTRMSLDFRIGIEGYFDPEKPLHVHFKPITFKKNSNNFFVVFGTRFFLEKRFASIIVTLLFVLRKRKKKKQC